MIICFACMQFSCVCQQPEAKVACRSPACNLSRRWQDRHWRLHALELSLQHCMTCSHLRTDFNLLYVAAGARGAAVIKRQLEFIHI